MPSNSIFADTATKPALDDSLYPLDKDRNALKVFQNITCIEDEEELKRHILRVQKKAYDIYGYPCIRVFSFVRYGSSETDEWMECSRIPIQTDQRCCAFQRTERR